MAVNGSRVVGSLELRVMSRLKIRHTGLVVVGLLGDYRHRGIGTRLFALLDLWAPSHGIHRLELTVMCHNRDAIHLYLKSGFVVEGLRPDSIRQPDGGYVDEYAMSRLVGGRLGGPDGYVSQEDELSATLGFGDGSDINCRDKGRGTIPPQSHGNA